MKPTYKLLVFILGSLLGTANLHAQDKPAEKKPEPSGTLSEEIEVVRPYKPVLANAAKIRRNPDLTTAPVFKPVLNYQISNRKLELNTDIRQLQYQQMAEQKPPSLSNNYLKIGAGTLKTGLAELYLNTKRNETSQAGLAFTHFSAQDKLPKQQFTKQQFSAFGKIIGGKYVISGTANYNQLGTYFYGNNPIVLLNPTPAKQILSTMKLQGELAKRFVEGDKKWGYNLSLQADLFSNATQGKENIIIINASGSKAVNNFTFGMNTKLDLSSIKQAGGSIENNLFKANPFARYSKDDFNLSVGINLIQEFGKVSKLNTLPSVEFSAPLSGKDIFFIAGLKGDVVKTSLIESSFINPYVGGNQAIQNSITKSDFFAGISGNFGPSVGFKAKGFFKRINNLPLFINNGSNLSTFDLIYDAGTSNLTGFNVDLHIQASDVFSLETSLESINYKLATETKAWFRPNFTLNTEARAQVNPKMALSASLNYRGQSYGKLANQPVTLKGYLNMDLGTSYQVAKKWTAFVQANNLLDTKYQQYLYYNGFGRQIFGGISYSF
jgi:outer membrane receptor protein involved in Fe transport